MKQLTEQQLQDLAILADWFVWIEMLEDRVKAGKLSASDEKAMQKLRELHNDFMS